MDCLQYCLRYALYTAEIYLMMDYQNSCAFIDDGLLLAAQ